MCVWAAEVVNALYGLPIIANRSSYSYITIFIKRIAMIKTAPIPNVPRHKLFWNMFKNAMCRRNHRLLALHLTKDAMRLVSCLRITISAKK